MFSLTPGKMVFRVDNSRLQAAIQTSPQLDTQLKSLANEIKDLAEREYRSQSLGTGTGDAGGSFVVNKLSGGPGYAAGLADWKSKFIEHGAMARGTTPVLGYRPLLNALDRVVAAAPSPASGLMGPRTIQV